MKTFHKAPLALAIAALMVAPYAMAEGYNSESSVVSDFTNYIDVEINHDSDTYKDFKTKIWTFGLASEYSGATVDSKQFSKGNDVNNQRSENNATLGGSSLSGASGNIGANVAAGDSNNQANDAALSASDAARVFGLMGQAAAFSAQTAAWNDTTNAGSPNTAILGGSALSEATGNIAANVVAGVGNSQQNSLAASSNAATGSADATTGGVQQTYGNTTDNVPHKRYVYGAEAVSATVTLDNVQLTMDQEGNQYPDIWTGDQHTGGTQIGHVDLDDDVQNGLDYNNDGGALAFNSTTDSVLSGTITGRMPSKRAVYTFHSNDATLAGSALSGASGNIGVNVAAGTNNLQRNSLSIAASMGGNGNGNGGNGGGE